MDDADDPRGPDGAVRVGTALPDRPSLSRDRIIDTAIRFVDEHGLTALTMRRLGRELGVEAMSLYRYVNGREDLLEGVVDQMVSQLHLRPDDDRLGENGGGEGLPAVAGPRG